MSVVREPVSITLAGTEYVLHNNLATRKGFDVGMGGLRPVMQSVFDLNGYKMAQAIAIASGQPKATDDVYAKVFEAGVESTARQLGDFFASLMDGSDDAGNAVKAEQ